MAEQLTLEAFRAKYQIKPGARPCAVAKRKLEPADLLVPGPSCAKVKPEEGLSIRVYQALLVEWHAGRLRATFTCIPNELPRPNRGGKSIASFAIAVQNKRRAMGRIPGASDFVFVWDIGGGWIELKDPGGAPTIRKVQRAAGPAFRTMLSDRGTESDEQRAFGAWCGLVGARRAICYSVDEVLATLAQWGALAR